VASQFDRDSHSFARRLQRARDPSASEKFKSFLAAGESFAFYCPFRLDACVAAVNAAKEAKKLASSVLSSAPPSGKLSTGTLATICQLLGDGNHSIEAACAAAGVGRTSLYANCSGNSSQLLQPLRLTPIGRRYRWLEQARDPSAPPKFKELALAVDAARLAVRSLPAKNHAPHVSCALQTRAQTAQSHGGPSERRSMDESHALSLSSSSSNDSFAVSDARTARCAKSVHSASDTSSCSSYSPPRGCLHVSV
jgi:hypothetical protein